ncbi:unnamed protein product [Adineta ricciae]|uniref:Uncharacterized protein n=1 Tax=Adineta ricciae TaxID=249248 RepID=A0A814T1V8_ADIRI|nr:unnamed protein product [Adineta ricciae]CAF1650670.1 unnamed protein product [Adineta ricciae]
MKAALFCILLIIGAFFCAEAERIYGIRSINVDLMSNNDEEKKVEGQPRFNNDDELGYKLQTRGKGKLALSVIRQALLKGWNRLPNWVKTYFGIDKIMELIDKYYHYSDYIEDIIENALYEASCLTPGLGCSPNAASNAATIIMWLLPI